MTKETKRVYEYQKEHYKRFFLTMAKEYYAQVLKPAADAAGESVNGYIKKAIAERVLRDNARRMGAQEGF